MATPGGLRRLRVAGLATALVLTGWLVFTASPRQHQAAAPGDGPAVSSLAQVWPTAEVVDAPAVLDDGTTYTPGLYLDPSTSIGTASTPDGVADRLLLRDRAGAPRELRRLARDAFPQFLAFTRAGDDVFWAESSAPVDGPYRTELWRMSVLAAGPPVRLVADAGDVLFYETQYDMVVDGGRLYWLAVSTGDLAATDVRSVLVTGGSITTETVDGQYQMSVWPWLQSAPGAGSGPVELRNIRTGQRRAITTTPAATVSCVPTWCRSIIVGGPDGLPQLYTLARPDGSDRRRVGGRGVSATITDVALLDRFEPVRTLADGQARLTLYDITADRLVVVADDAVPVYARQGLLWWLTGDGDTAAWHSLDLKSLNR